MSDAFNKLCAEVYRATERVAMYEQCFPQYQRVLDYIHAHPEEREEITSAFSQSLRGQPSGLIFQIYLVQFLMTSLKWPEIKAAAEYALKDEELHRYDSGGSSGRWHEYEHLIEIYG